MAARDNQKRVCAIVRLFGEISYFETLSDTYGGPCASR
jgi:hypothetical protein